MCKSVSIKLARSPRSCMSRLPVKCQGQTQQAHFRDGAGSQHIQLVHTSLFLLVSAFQQQTITKL